MSSTTDMTMSLNSTANMTSNVTSVQPPAAAAFNPMDLPMFRISFEMYPIQTYILVIIGTFGNILSFLVLSRKSMCMSSSSVYLRSLSFSDTMCLWVHLISMVVQKYPPASVIVTTWFCRVFYYVGNFFSATSVWFVMAMTIERSIVVMFPLKAPLLVSKQKSMLAIGILCLMAAVLEIYCWWMIHALGVLCRYNNTQFGRFLDPYGVFQSFVAQFIPMVLVLVFNCLIIFQMFRARNIKKSLTNPEASNDKDNKKAKETDQARQVAVMLLTISITFFVFNLPITLYNASLDFWIVWEDPYIYGLATLLQIISLMFILMNYSTNFILYCLTGTKFRQELMCMLFCREAPKRYGSSTATSRMSSVSATVQSKANGAGSNATKPEQVAVQVA